MHRLPMMGWNTRPQMPNPAVTSPMVATAPAKLPTP